MNVILLVLDALRYDFVTDEITPNLTKIAGKGAFFTHAFACNSATKLSIPCILSSNRDFDPEENIAAILSRNGYHTAMIHSNPIVHNFYAGFKETLDIKATALRPNTGLFKKVIRQLPPSVRKGVKRVRTSIIDEEKYLPYKRAGETLEYTLGWMEEHDRYFLWTHLMDPHIPYYPVETSLDLTRKELISLNDKIIEVARRNEKPTEEEVEMARTLYTEEVQGMDLELRYFFENFNDDNLLVITSDHGDEFYEYRGMSHPGNKIIPELIHVPLILYGGGVQPGQVIDDYASHYNIAPTILEALGMEAEIGYGRSLWGKIAGLT